VSRRKRTPSAPEGRREDWLGRGLPVRGRPWALEEQLLGTVSDKSRSRVLDVLTSDLADERAGLSRLEEELREQAVRVASLESRLTLLRGRAAGGSSEDGRPVERTVTRVRLGGSSLGRDYWLCRCEGFWVDSPAGRIGLVEGLRFLSRIDRPDLLEIRAGLLGRQLLLIQTDQVEDIIVAEGRLVLRDTPRLRGDHLHELLARLRHRRPATP
jgi:hypothetical protein